MASSHHQPHGVLSWGLIGDREKPCSAPLSFSSKHLLCIGPDWGWQLEARPEFSPAAGRVASDPLNDPNTITGSMTENENGGQGQVFKVTLLMRVCSAWPQKINLNWGKQLQRRRLELNRGMNSEGLDLLENELIPL